MTSRRLLLPLSPDQKLSPAIHQALHFANLHHSQVTLLTVIEELAELKELVKNSVSILNLFDMARNDCLQQLEHHVQVLQPDYPNIRFQTRVETGIPFVEIIRLANSSGTGLIVIDAQRGNKKQACQWGSTTRHLMRKSPVPIWAISRQAYHSTTARIAVALNVADSDDEMFNSKILRLGYELASVSGACLYPCHAWRLDSEGYLRKWNHCTDLDIALIAGKLKKERSERLRALTEPYRQFNTPLHQVLLEGEPQEVLPDFVASQNIDLVVMGSLSRTGVAGFLMGNRAEYMLDALQCSVITLKPDDFCSPVLT